MAKPKTESITKLLTDIEAMRDEFAAEVEKRKGLGGYSADAGTLLSLCQTTENVLGILYWLVSERKKHDLH